MWNQTVKLYYSPGACALTIHVLLNDMAVPYDLVRVDLKQHKTKDGQDYRRINPKGYVPLLALDSGEQISELPAIAQYLSESQHSYGLFPEKGLAKIRVVEWLAFIGSEVHKNFAPLFNSDSSTEAKHSAKQKLMQRFDYVNQDLAQKNYLTGDHISIADIYLFVVLRWTEKMQLDLSNFADLTALQQRVHQYPAVQQSLREEGLD
ncbi:MAG: glutathione transferase GstA [Moraxellaceae bacterium]|nr:MAG: glutathione transferase GstA [Moraxellaceae bacterium]